MPLPEPRCISLLTHDTPMTLPCIRHASLHCTHASALPRSCRTHYSPMPRHALPCLDMPRHASPCLIMLHPASTRLIMPYFILPCSASRRLLIFVMPHHASHHTSPCLTHIPTGMACTCMADPPISLQSSRPLSRQPSSRSRILHLTSYPFTAITVPM